MSPRKNDPLLTPAETAYVLRTTVGTLRVWRSLNKGPSYMKRGRSVLYRQSAVDRFVEQWPVVAS